MLGDFIEYIYIGEILVKGENVVDLLYVVCVYEIFVFVNVCCDWFSF